MCHSSFVTDMVSSGYNNHLKKIMYLTVKTSILYFQTNWHRLIYLTVLSITTENLVEFKEKCKTLLNLKGKVQCTEPNRILYT